MNNKKVGFGALGLVVLAGVLGIRVWTTQGQAPGTEPVHEPETKGVVSDGTNSGKSRGDFQEQAQGGADDGFEHFRARKSPERPDSLSGTEVDGGVRADEQGRLIVEARIRRMFEYYLSTLGEASLAEVKTWVAHHLNENLPASAAREAWSLFRDYLDYRRGLEAITQPGPDADMDAVARTMERRNALRREKLGREAAQAFFGAEEAYDEYMLRRRAIAQNGLSGVTRAGELVAAASYDGSVYLVRPDTRGVANTLCIMRQHVAGWPTVLQRIEAGNVVRL